MDRKRGRFGEHARETTGMRNGIRPEEKTKGDLIREKMENLKRERGDEARLDIKRMCKSNR